MSEKEINKLLSEVKENEMRNEEFFDNERKVDQTYDINWKEDLYGGTYLNGIKA